MIIPTNKPELLAGIGTFCGLLRLKIDRVLIEMMYIASPTGRSKDAPLSTSPKCLILFEVDAGGPSLYRKSTSRTDTSFFCEEL